MTDIKYKRKKKLKVITYTTLLTSIFLTSNLLSPIQIHASTEVEQEEKAIHHDKSDSNKSAEEFTEVMGLTTYKINKDKNTMDIFEKIIIDTISEIPVENRDVESMKDIRLIKLKDDITYNDELDNKIHEDSYMYGSYLVTVQNFDLNLAGKQKVTVKYRFLSMIEQKQLELTKTVKTINNTFNFSDTNIASKTFIIDLKDISAPVINLRTNSVEIKVGDTFKIANYIKSITDDTDKKIDYKIEGNYDVNHEGTYPLKIIAKDSSGNIGSKKFKLIVKKPITIVNTALKLSSSPYVWGGTTPSGFDCSGFVQYVFAQNGISLPRVAADQGASGYAVSASEMQAGDIIIYGGGVHVGIYIGNGQVIHALNPTVGIITGQWDYPYNGAVSAIRRVL